MNTRKRLLIPTIAAGFLAVGCAAQVDRDVEESLVTASEALTPCNGPAISAAVSAGGDVALDCGAAPVTISVPATSVTRTTRLHAIRPGTITFTHLGGLFSIASSVNFEIDDIKFNGQGHSSIAVHSVGGLVTLKGTSFEFYRGLTVSVHNGSRLTVLSSSFSNNNSTVGFAGPIYSEGSTTSVTNSIFSNNVSNGTGGAIIQLGGSLTVSASTFVGNGAQTGAAIALTASGSQTITNSTFASNTASNGGGAINAAGLTNTMLRNCTFSLNVGAQGTFSGSGSINMFNSILYDPNSPSNAPCNVTGATNIQWPVARCAGIPVADPRLLALANNGGPTPTIALSPGSAAIDRATSVCPITDQRGVTRPRDGDGNGSAICDIGAYER